MRLHVDGFVLVPAQRNATAAKLQNFLSEITTRGAERKPFLTKDAPADAWSPRAFSDVDLDKGAMEFFGGVTVALSTPPHPRQVVALHTKPHTLASPKYWRGTSPKGAYTAMVTPVATRLTVWPRSHEARMNQSTGPNAPTQLFHPEDILVNNGTLLIMHPKLVHQFPEWTHDHEHTMLWAHVDLHADAPPCLMSFTSPPGLDVYCCSTASGVARQAARRSKAVGCATNQQTCNPLLDSLCSAYFERAQTTRAGVLRSDGPAPFFTSAANEVLDCDPHDTTHPRGYGDERDEARRSANLTLEQQRRANQDAAAARAAIKEEKSTERDSVTVNNA